MKPVALLLAITFAITSGKANSAVDEKLVTKLQKNPCAPQAVETGSQKIARAKTELEFYRFMSGKDSAINNLTSQSDCHAYDTCETLIRNLETSQKMEEENINRWVVYLESQNALLEMKNSRKASEAKLEELRGKRAELEKNLKYYRQNQSDYQNSISHLMTKSEGKLTSNDEQSIQYYSNLYGEMEKVSNDYQAVLDWIDKDGVGWLENNRAFDEYVGVLDLSSVKEQQLNIIEAQDRIEQNYKRIDVLKARIKGLRKQFTAEQLDAMALKDFNGFADQLLKDVLSRGNFKRCGLSSAELYAIFDYTGSGYSALNKSLRSGSTEYKVYLSVLNNALRKLAPVKGGFRMHRGASFSPEMIATLLPGKYLNYVTPVSTGLFNAFSGNVAMEIKGKSGRYVGTFSDVADEHEVLFPAPTRFKIVKRIDKGQGNIFLQLEEVGTEETAPTKSRLPSAKKPAPR